MTLDEYLTSSGMTAAEFGPLVPLSEASVSRIRKGEQNISRDLMRRIIDASGGVITAAALVHDGADTAPANIASPGNAKAVSPTAPVAL